MGTKDHGHILADREPETAHLAALHPTLLRPDAERPGNSAGK
jgi:hypothetical protein